ncbi:rhodanese-like domain-containing protein [Desulfobacula toluolica]|uniref:Rhodanese domain protein n=1 Tax=Desulfobacula toluolica (strain DSM 7467 / Tol2) TaxID=651182 RepID=K0NAK9_DESTT|nr:rhodanese-like domain-containing protein [Desulfobacula toluolica]CCK81094.1 rhodanese domain protein [Desulfobacula toluolica Tol2]
MNGSSSGYRRHFYRKSICDARLEFSRIDSQEKIIEAALLTAIGTLGVTCGFSCINSSEEKTVEMVSRGIDAEAIAFVENNFYFLNQQYFSLLQTTFYPFQTDLRIMEADQNHQVQLTDIGIQILVGWRMGKDIFGSIGLGPKIISDTYEDDELNFCLTLTDTMIIALQSLAIRRRMQELKADLDKAEDRAVDLAHDVEKAKKDLDRTLFRLSGFNDIFNELSGLKQSKGIIDSFLMVLLGIFGAGGGYIYYFDKALGKAYSTCRNLDLPGKTEFLQEKIQAGMLHAFASNRALQLEPMQAAVLSRQQMDCFKPFLPEIALGLIFKVDEPAMGVIGLDHRIIQVPYGEKERELLLAFAKNFLVFLKNSKSFETIQRLHLEQEQKNIELENTIKALSDSSRTIARLEKAGEHIKAAIAKAMAQSWKVSGRDIVLILIAGIVLGLVYNFASPGRINVIPKEWLRPAMVHVDVDQARQLFENSQAIFVDARPAEFFNQGHIAGAQNLPPSLFDFIYMMRFSQTDVTRPIVVYGRNISRRYDEETAFNLLERGHENVVVFPGGIKEWEKK